MHKKKFHGMFTMLAARGMQGEVGVGGGGWELRVFREEAPDTKVPNVVASTASLGRQFQSVIVLGKNEMLLYCVLAVNV